MDSKDRLKEEIRKNITTTMIGALASIEDKLGFLWEERTPKSDEYYELFEQLRTEILDKGNDQIKLAIRNLDKYEVEYRKYFTQFRIKND